MSTIGTLNATLRLGSFTILFTACVLYIYDVSWTMPRRCEVLINPVKGLECVHKIEYKPGIVIHMM